MEFKEFKNSFKNKHTIKIEKEKEKKRVEVDKFAYKPQQNVGSFDSNFYIKLSTTK